MDLCDRKASYERVCICFWIGVAILRTALDETGVAEVQV